ncbi:hypothetical protein DDB_G0290003 [Dictyostelium discoideum AX4]|uniref:Putative uncharacterized protein DDB_G0290003 n=1 Tax=Dictyostelium discoideum TaxID=44689 RepID=Y5951_DICDI|nr:hypothetical protein DDB_G0290003 [Dictyostelium discoideum AX4]Q54GQ9.1 RecName: Full=Putative uncharacterized protein DDB_G0290003 [Dictyostelium discoideum]EAL62447.1 hypothetical protein DDB_G0290003 [Dictyostelium discoideum AX4]|eukprot:XP_635943.1 hypothetical protein DDB_G0290003 [Dictyostelium discoideum AX4]
MIYESIKNINFFTNKNNYNHIFNKSNYYFFNSNNTVASNEINQKTIRVVFSRPCWGV